MKTFLIKELWQNGFQRRIFLNILNNTQLKKCKELKQILCQKIDTLVKYNTNDCDIYSELHEFIHQSLEKRKYQKIQHKAHYRSANRANKIIEFVTDYCNTNVQNQNILDLGCDDGTITNVVASLLHLNKKQIQGCDIKPSNNCKRLFTYKQLDCNEQNTLPYENNTFDVVYAFMSLHHIQNIGETIAEVQRILKPNGIFIIREHNCLTKRFSHVLDVVHGFYSMVWSFQQEKHDFMAEYWAEYKSAIEWEQLICAQNFDLLLATQSKEKFPKYHNGHIINPLQHYYAIFRKK